MEDFNFEDEFLSDEEVWEALDEALLDLAKDVDADEDCTAFLNIARQKQIGIAYTALKYILNGTGAKVTYRLHEPYKSMGVVSVVGKNLAFVKGDVFIKIARLASNVDIYPRVDSTVQIDFTFHGLTVVID